MGNTNFARRLARPAALASMAAWAISLPAMALAQASPPASPPADAAAPDQTLGDIVVTAEKRQTSVQKTPISMSVVSAATIKENGIGNLQDVVKILPAVSFAKNFANSIVTIRGVSSRDTDETGDPAVALSIDGFYFNRSIGLNEAIFDLERVEVLRGPQGTLYGRSATGGAINFITAKPEKDFDAYAGLTVGNYADLETEGMINVPLSDKVQIRAAFQTRNHDGYRNNAPARDGDDADSKAARLHIAFQPTERLSILLTGEFVKDGGVGTANYGTPLLFNADGSVVHAKPALPHNGRTWAEGLPSSSLDVKTYFARWNFQYDFGPVTLSYNGGYRHLDFNYLLNLDGQTGHAGLYGTNSYFAPQHEIPKTMNHELQLKSNGHSRFEWQIGAYYFDEDNDLLSNFSYFDSGTAPRLAFQFRYPSVGARSEAVFGQAAYHITDKLKVEAGMRYSWDQKFRTGYANYAAFDLFIPIDQHASFTKPTWHVGANYQLTSRNLLYAKVDTGYKPGGFTDVAAYGPESITAYEIGSKNRFLDDKLELNVDAYYYNYKDQQVLQFVGAQTIIRNAGKSEYYGVEIEGAFLPTPRDRFDAFVGYNHAEYKVFAIADGAVNLNLAGKTPPQAPRLSTNLGYEHTFDAFGGTIKARVQTHIESHSHLQFYNYPSDLQPAYTRTDLSLTYAPDSKRWLVEGFVRNVENRTVITAAQEQSLLQSYVYQFADPRTFGARIRINW